MTRDKVSKVLQIFNFNNDEEQVIKPSKGWTVVHILVVLRNLDYIPYSGLLDHMTTLV